MWFFWRSECKLIENIFGIRKIFVSWRAKHEATYIVNTKTYEKNVDWVRARQRTSIVESHILLDCSHQVTAKCSTMPAKSTWNTHQFTLHLISFIPFLEKNWYFRPLPPKTMLIIKGNIIKEAQKKVLPKILTRFIVNQHCSVGERGMIGFDLGN